MRINTAVFIIFCLILIISPTIEGWLRAPGDSWWRGHLVWLMLIVLVFILNQRRSDRDF